MYFKEPTNVNNCHYQFTEWGAVFVIVLKQHILWWTGIESTFCAVYVHCTFNFALKFYIYKELEINKNI